jgi:hypothetical protein
MNPANDPIKHVVLLANDEMPTVLEHIRFR